MTENVDLYELTISVDLTGVKAQLFKYPTKRTQQNFIPMMLTENHWANGYSCRMRSRVPISNLNKVQRIGPLGSCANATRFAYFLLEDKDKVMQEMREVLAKEIVRLRDNALKLHEVWTTKPFVVEAKQSLVP